MRTSVNLDEDSVAEFDRIWREEGLDSRSRAIREAMAEYVENHSRLEETTGEIVALLGFDYRQHAVIEQLHTVQHDYQDVIQHTSHTHQGEWCLEALFCRGPADRVRELAYALQNFDEVRRVKEMVIQAGEGDDQE